jgi:hypothetical protein
VRNKLTRFRAEKLSAPEQLATLIKGWNYMQEGRLLQRIQLTRGQERGNPVLTNANFPMPKGLKRRPSLAEEAEAWAIARDLPTTGEVGEEEA